MTRSSGTSALAGRRRGSVAYDGSRARFGQELTPDFPRMVLCTFTMRGVISETPAC